MCAAAGGTGGKSVASSARRVSNGRCASEGMSKTCSGAGECHAGKMKDEERTWKRISFHLSEACERTIDVAALKLLREWKSSPSSV